MVVTFTPDKPAIRFTPEKNQVRFTPEEPVQADPNIQVAIGKFLAGESTENPVAPGQTIIPTITDPIDVDVRFVTDIEQEDPSFLKRMFTIGGKGLWKGLGIISWPFERIGYTIATPLTTTLESRKETLRQRGESTIGFGVLRPRLVSSKEAKREFSELLPALKAIGQAWIPGREVPENVRTYGDFWGSYREALTGEPAPQWYKNTIGIATEFLLDPFVFSKLAKMIGKTVKLTGIPQKITAKALPAWKLAKLEARAKTGARITKAGELGKSLGRRDLKKLAQQLSKETGKPIGTRAVQQRLGQLIKGGITTRPELAAKANPIIEEFARNAEILRGLKILPKETFLTKLPKKRIAELTKQRMLLQSQIAKLQKWPTRTPKVISGKTGKELQRRFPGQAEKIQKLQGRIDDIADKIQQSYKIGGEKYLPRMYRSKEEERLAIRFTGWSKHRIRAHYAKRRQKIPDEVRKIMGEIKEPAFPVMKRLIQQGSDIETAKLYEFAARNPKWVSHKWVPGLAKKALPDTKAFGALRGKFVHPTIHSDVTELNRMRGDFEKIYETLIGSWKLGKVVLNPATHMRNKISNKILLDLSGMGYGEQAKYALRALKEFRSNSKDYQIAKQYFARTSLVRGELLDDILRTTSKSQGASAIERGINATRRGVKWLTKKPSDIYQHEEFVNKFMKYLQQKDQGKSTLQAIQEANKWLFDYGDLATWERNIARRIIPFYTFPRKALPRVAEAMIERPLTVAKYPLIAKLTTQASLARLEMDDEDYEQLRNVLPQYMQQGSYILMPYRDDNGDLRFFDWTYIVPWGELNEIGETNIGSILLSNPFVRITADVAANKSIWTGRKIYDDRIPPEEQTSEYRTEQTLKKVKYVWGSLMPSLAPKGLYWDKLLEAAQGKPLKTIPGKEKKRLLPETIAHVLLGLRTQAIDPEEQRHWRLREKQGQIGEVQKNMRDAVLRWQSGNITDDEYFERRDIYLKQIEKLLKSSVFK